MSEFYLMRPGEFWEAVEAHSNEVEAERRHIGELIRGATLRILGPHLKRPVTDIASWWPMPWDEKKIDEEREEIERLNNLTDEQRANEARAFLELINGEQRTQS